MNTKLNTKLNTELNTKLNIFFLVYKSNISQSHKSALDTENTVVGEPGTQIVQTFSVKKDYKEDNYDKIEISIAQDYILTIRSTIWQNK